MIVGVAWFPDYGHIVAGIFTFFLALSTGTFMYLPMRINFLIVPPGWMDGWIEDENLPPGWMDGLKMKISLQVGWMEDDNLPPGWMDGLKMKIFHQVG